jgi:hypothetical protein
MITYDENYPVKQQKRDMTKVDSAWTGVGENYVQIDSDIIAKR